MHPQRPLRTTSLHFDEAQDLEVMRSAYELGSDAIVYDLEDHVPRHLLPSARANIRTVLEELGDTKPTLVRVNRMGDHEILDDLEAIVCPELFAVVLPKVEHPSEIATLDHLLTMFETRAGIELGQILIQPYIESALGNRLAYDIAMASPRTAYMGGMISRNGDPALSIGFEWTPELRETLYLRQKVQLDCMAAGMKWTMTGIWNPLHDLEGLERFMIESRQIGYSGAICMPVREHVEVIHRVFSPLQEDIDYWAEIIPMIDAVQTDVIVGGEVLPPNKAKWGRRKLALAEWYGIEPSPDRKKLEVEGVGSLVTRAQGMVNDVPSIPTKWG